MRRSYHKMLIFMLVLTSCSSTITTYDQYAYVQTTSLKVDALDVMSSANEDYAVHEKEVKVVNANIRKLIEYEKYRSKNEETSTLWKILADTNGHLYGGFIREWRNKHQLKPAYIPLKQAQVNEAFDKIILLESLKIKR